MSDDIIDTSEWREVVDNKEAEVLQILWEYARAKITDINNEIQTLNHKRSGFYEMEAYIYDLQKVRGYAEPKS